MREIEVAEAARQLARGEVIAYPTESVFGLGCDPLADAAIERICRLKGRPLSKGMLMVAAAEHQIEHWLDPATAELELARSRGSWPGPVTWVFSGHPDLRSLAAADDGTVAFRISNHPTVKALCQAFGGPIVSTSANPSGRAPIRSQQELAAAFSDRLAFCVAGQLGNNINPSEIRDARTGEVLRHG